MTPQLLAILSVPVLVGGLAFTIYNFYRASKMIEKFDFDGFSGKMVGHLVGGLSITIGGIGTLVSVIWYAATTFN